MDGLVWVLVLLIWQFYGSVVQASRTPHVLFVSVPVYRHADPLVEIASQYATQYGVPVRFAVPSWFAPNLFAGMRQELLKLLDVALLDHVPDPRPLSEVKTPDDLDCDSTMSLAIESCTIHNYACNLRDSSGLSNTSRGDLRRLFEKSMTDALLRLYGFKLMKPRNVGDKLEFRRDSGPHHHDLPALIVVDRYTLAGFNFAHFTKTPFVLHNPWTLLDIDEPPPFVRSPGAGPSAGNLHILSRLRNFWHRLKGRIQDARYAQESYSEVRESLNLGSLDVPGGYCEERLVLSDTVLGWLDEPRPMPPLQQLIGAVLPPRSRISSFSASSNFGNGRPEFNQSPRDSQQNQFLLLQGTYPQEDLEVIFRASADLNMTVIQLGERCLNYNLLSRFCDYYARHQHSDFQAQRTDLGEEDIHAEQIVLLANGDMSCVHLAGVCNNIKRLLVYPILPEQHEVAAHGYNSGIVSWIFQGPLKLRDVKKAFQTTRKDVQQDHQLRLFGYSLRVAGGTKRASLWISRALDFELSHFLPLDCGLPWHQNLFIDVYALYFCGLLASVVVLKIIWGMAAGAVDPLSEQDADGSSIFKFDDGPLKLLSDREAQENLLDSGNSPSIASKSRSATPSGRSASNSSLQRRRGRTSDRQQSANGEPETFSGRLQHAQDNKRSTCSIPSDSFSSTVASKGNEVDCFSTSMETPQGVEQGQPRPGTQRKKKLFSYERVVA